MICPHCNKETADDSKVCQNCGTRLVNPESVPQQEQPATNIPNPQQEQASPDTSNQQQAPSASSASAAKSGFTGKLNQLLQNKKLLITIGSIAGAVLILLVVGIILVVTHKTTINLHDYTKVEFEGYDGHGKATLNFDSKKLAVDVADAMGIDTENSSSLSSLMSGLGDYGKLASVFSSTKWQLDKDSNLKNGDTVTVTYKYDNEKAGECKVAFEGEPMSFPVSGLDKIQEKDPFENVTLKFEGTAPNVSASVENTSTDEILSRLYFNVEPSNNLKAGDKVKVSVSNYNENDFIAQHGCLLTPTEKEFTVENVDTYITETNQIGNTLLNDMKKQTLDSVKAYFANNSSYLKHKGIKYVGYYFLTAKEDDTWGEHNRIYIVYSSKVKNRDKSIHGSATVYFPVEFTNLIKYANGTDYVDLNSSDIKGYTYFKFGSCYGYKSIKAMKNELITSQLGDFNSVAEGKLK